jgi:vacuolar iron transporter family protein
VPLLPYLVGSANLVLALAVAGVALFLAGALVGRLTATSMWSRGLRQLALAALAAGVTFAVGRAIGTSVS